MCKALRLRDAESAIATRGLKIGVGGSGRIVRLSVLKSTKTSLGLQKEEPLDDEKMPLFNYFPVN